MSKETSEALAPRPAAETEGSATLALPGRAVMSRRRAIPLIGLAVVVAGGCNISENPFEVDPNAEAERLRRALADARVHRGGSQRFVLQNLVDNVAVEVEHVVTKRAPYGLTVTVYEVDPETRHFIRDGARPRILEVHRNVNQATISQIESDYMFFYYLYEN